MLAFASIQVVKQVQLLLSCSYASSCNTSTFAHVQLHRDNTLTFAHVQLHRGHVCPNLCMLAFVSVEVVKHVHLLLSCSNASSCHTSIFAHGQLHRDQVCPNLRMVAFAPIEVVKHVRLLLSCINQLLPSSHSTCAVASIFAPVPLHRGNIDVLGMRRTRSA
jgi:hypothetical protein